MEIPKEFLKNSILTYIFSYLVIPFGYFMRIIYSRELSIEEYGLFYSILGFYLLISLFNDFGLSETLNYYGTKFYERKDYQNLKLSLYYAIISQVVTAIIISTIIIIFSQTLEINYFKYNNTELYLKLMLGYFIATNISKPLSTIFNVKQKNYYNQILNFIRLSITLLSSLLIYIYIYKLEIIILSWGLGYLIISLISIYYIKKEFKKEFKNLKIYYDSKLLKKLLKYSWPLVLSSGAIVLINGIDIQIITYFKDLTQVALYSNATSIASILVYLLVPINLLILPLVTKYIENENKNELSILLSQIYKLIFFLGTPTLLMFITFPTEIIKIIYGEKYTNASLTLILLSLGYFFNLFSAFNFSLMSGFGKVKIKTKILYTIAIFNLTGDLLIVSKFGFEGVAAITCLSFLLMMILTFKINFKLIKFNFGNLFYTKLIITNIFFITSIYSIKKLLEINLIYKISIIIILIGPIYLILGNLLKIYNYKEIQKIFKKTN